MSVRVKLKLYYQPGYVYLKDNEISKIVRSPGQPTEVTGKKKKKYLVCPTPDEIQEEITYKRSALNKQSQSWGIAQW